MTGIEMMAEVMRSLEKARLLCEDLIPECAQIRTNIEILLDEISEAQETAMDVMPLVIAAGTTFKLGKRIQIERKDTPEVHEKPPQWYSSEGAVALDDLAKTVGWVPPAGWVGMKDGIPLVQRDILPDSDNDDVEQATEWVMQARRVLFY